VKNIFVGLLSAVMIYRVSTTLVFLPFTAPLWSSTGIYFVLLVLLAIGATALSFTRRKWVTALLASALGLIALSYWWVISCKAQAPIWSDFIWGVVPELCFSFAGICKWSIGLSGSPPADIQPMRIG
jgi:hypothetical protein